MTRFRFFLLRLLLAIPLGGFALGFIVADAGANVVNRAFVGLVFALLTPLTFGLLPGDSAGTNDTYNAWPAIGIVFLLLCLWRRKKRATLLDSDDNPENDAP